MKFPNLVYISPGPHQFGASSFGYRSVNNLDELEQAVKDGYYPTPEIAVKKPTDFDWTLYAEQQGWMEEESEPEASTENVAEDTAADLQAPPTRAELEAKADELKIKYNGNTKDETLAEKIAAAIADSKEE